MEVTLVFPHQLFDPHPAITAGRPVHLVEDPLLFGTDPHWPLGFHVQKLILHRASDPLKARLMLAGFKVHEVELTEFLKAGGSAKCLSLRLTEPVRGQ